MSISKVRGGRRDLEMDRLALVDADVGRKALQGRVARPADIPFRPGRAGLLVLADDRIRAALGREPGIAGLRNEEQQRGECAKCCQQGRSAVVTIQEFHM